MKKICYLFLGLILLSCSDDDESFTVDCLPSNLQDGVIAFYPFINGSLDDASTQSNDLFNTTMARPAPDRDGNVNCAFQFDNTQGADEFLGTTRSDFLDSRSEMSISLWYQPLASTRSGGDYEVLVGRGFQTNTRCPDRRGEWTLGLYDCRRVVFGHDMSVWAEPVTDFTLGCDGEADALTDTWHHVVAVKKDDNYQLYFNGELDDTDMGTASCSDFQAARDIGDFLVGVKFTGRIDDILVYRRALIASEVTELFELEVCCR